MNPAEYLAREREADRKSEFLGGRLHPRDGASRRHNLITFNLAVILGQRLAGRPCEGYIADMRVKIASTGSYAYPDVVIACGDPQFEDNQFDTLMNPQVLIEILSPSTEAKDRGVKSAGYREIASLKEYALIVQEEIRIERFRRQGERRWEMREFVDPSEILDFESINCRLQLRAIYEKVRFDDREKATPDQR